MEPDEETQWGQVVAALNRLADVLTHRWGTIRKVGIAVAVSLVAIAVALLLLWGVAQDTNGIASRSEDTQTSSACSLAATRKFPRLLADDAELAKALEWTQDCNRLNGVKAPPIKLPK